MKSPNLQKITQKGYKLVVMDEEIKSEQPKKEPYITPSKRPGRKSREELRRENIQNARAYVKTLPPDNFEADGLNPEENLVDSTYALINWLSGYTGKFGIGGDEHFSVYAEDDGELLITSNEEDIQPMVINQDGNNDVLITFVKPSVEKEKDLSAYTNHHGVESFMILAGVVSDRKLGEQVRFYADLFPDLSYLLTTKFFLGKDKKIYKAITIPSNINHGKEVIERTEFRLESIMSEMDPGDYELYGKIIYSFLEKTTSDRFESFGDEDAIRKAQSRRDSS